MATSNNRKWFLSLSPEKYSELCAEWTSNYLGSPRNITGYDQWLNFFKELSPSRIRQLLEDGEEIFSTEAYAALRRWADIIDAPGRIDKIYQAGLAKPKTEQKSITELAAENNKLGVLYAIRDNIAEKLDKGTGSRDTANLAREMSNILDQITEAERRQGPGKNTKLAQLIQPFEVSTVKTQRSRKGGARRTSFKSIKEVEG